MASSTSARIARDRGVSGFFALIASLPAVAGMLGLAWVAYRFVTDEPDQFEADGGWLMLALLALFVFLFFIVARWTYDAVQAGLTPQRVQAMWLRRFQSESGGAFRTSRVIDRLSRHGVSALTLQDRDVQLSFEQRRNRLAPVFWLLFIPMSLLLAYVLWQAWQGAQADIMDMPEAETFEQGVGQIFGAMIALIAIGALLAAGFFFGILATLALVMLIAALAGPIGAMFTKARDDFASLPKLLKRIERGKGRRGAEIVRVSDANWREAVCSSLAAVDVAIIDLTDVSDHVAWEIGEAAKACGASGLVFICSDAKRGLTDGARATVRHALGRDPSKVVFYPARRGRGDADRFARQLREQIYEAADLREVAKA